MEHRLDLRRDDINYNISIILNCNFLNLLSSESDAVDTEQDEASWHGVLSFGVADGDTGIDDAGFVSAAIVMATDGLPLDKRLWNFSLRI